MASKKPDSKVPHCEGCLWTAKPPKVTPSKVASVVCLHSFCIQCIKGYAQQTKKKESGKSFWFRCPVSTCGVMIQSNQLKDLSSKDLPQPLQYLLKSCNPVKCFTDVQKMIQFHLDNNKG